MNEFIGVKFFLYKNGIHLCIFSLILISFSFMLLPLSSYDDTPAGFHPLFPLLIIGLSFIGLLLTLVQRKIDVKIGTLGYFIPLLILGPIYISGFEARSYIPEDPQIFQWEIGMHLVIISLVFQYMVSLFISPWISNKNGSNIIDEGEDPNSIIGYSEVIIGMLKEIAHALFVISFLLVILFLVFTPLKVFHVI